MERNQWNLNHCFVYLPFKPNTNLKNHWKGINGILIIVWLRYIIFVTCRSLLQIFYSRHWTQPTFVATECKNDTGKIGTIKFLFLGPGTLVDYSNFFVPTPGIEPFIFVVVANHNLNHYTTRPNSNDLLMCIINHQKELPKVKN